MRVGIIGAGTIAQLHLRALGRMPGTTLAGILDTRPGAAASLAARSGGVAAFDDPQSFYAEAQPQVVHVLTPPATHHDVAVDALRRGQHVLVEKPLAMTAEECRSMAREVERSGATLGVDHNFLFDPRVQEALRRVRSGAVGEPVHVETTFGFDLRRVAHHAEEGRDHWVHSLPGGLLEDLLPHPLYLTLAFLGDGATVTDARSFASGRLGEGSPDELRLSLASGGVTAHITQSLAIRPDPFTVTVYGDRGSLRLDVQNMLLQPLPMRRGPRALARGVAVAETSLRALAGTAVNAAAILARRGVAPGDPAPLIRAHHEALAEGREVPVDVHHGARVVEIMRQVWPLA